MTVETAVPEKQRRAALKGVDFLADEEPSVSETVDERIGQRLSRYLEEIDSMTLQDDRLPIELARGNVGVKQERLQTIVRNYPDGFPAALEDGNFGMARSIAESGAEPYEKMVMVYGFYELYGAIGQLQESDQAVRDIAAAITAFGTAINRGNTEMAQLSLKRASDAFVSVTRELVDGARTRLRELRGLLVYHDLSDAFDRHIERRPDLQGGSLGAYLDATDSLVDSARRQHERAEKAREVYHLFSKQE